ncbi:hypothetical protein [Trinickia symbiotica]|uniref:hypothetical protein n=1 Tax=Trinickia symbiotica TaxID=863227 RepID=UPI00036F9C4C|nr:hypothetical protein [Trinickia symbiotica]
MNATLTYAMITARAEHELHAFLELAAKQRDAQDVTAECITRGGALGVLSMWEGLVADLDGLLDAESQTDRARLFALIDPDTASSAPR